MALIKSRGDHCPFGIENDRGGRSFAHFLCQLPIDGVSEKNVAQSRALDCRSKVERLRSNFVKPSSQQEIVRLCGCETRWTTGSGEVGSTPRRAALKDSNRIAVLV